MDHPILCGTYRMAVIMEIKKFQPLPETEAVVTGYLHDHITEMETYRKYYPAVVVCPGGGYEMVSEREADPVALRYFAAGYQVFTLRYSVGDAAKNFTPLRELAETVAKIRQNAELYRVDAAHIAVCGFSAGGHLAASLGTLWNNGDFLRWYDRRDQMHRPNALILCYPVILAGEKEHPGSIDRVSVIEEGTLQRDFFSLDKQVTKDTPTSFLWTTAEDDCVPAENSIAFLSALQREKVSYEAHIFPYGGHGLSVCTQEVGAHDTYNARWMDMSIEWLNTVFSYTR